MYVESKFIDRQILINIWSVGDIWKCLYNCSTAPHKAIHERWTVLKSAHVHKKHRVQYEIRTYYRYLDFLKLTGSTADTFLEYLQRNLPEGVAMKVTKVKKFYNLIKRLTFFYVLLFLIYFCILFSWKFLFAGWITKVTRKYSCKV